MMLGEPKPEVSAVTENYLQAIYKLGERKEAVSPTLLAEVMDVSVATAVGTVKRLTRQNMVEVATNKEVSLTSKGLEVAESVVRRHRLAERMLIEMLGLEWYKAHREAHRLEHAISPDVERKLVEALGYPETNPYGLPIPGYSSAQQKTRPLADGGQGEHVEVSQVPEEDIQLLTYFDEINVKPGAHILVKETAPFKGTVTIEVEGEEVVLGLEVARKILVAA
jgi:DtxR family Mn-dependent transcriptional regulator